MKLTKLSTGPDQKSYFQEVESEGAFSKPLGIYSKPYAVKEMFFRDSIENTTLFTWHPAPQAQYIIYLEGEVEVVASGGERRIFKAGDILFVTDTTGAGHTSHPLTAGRALIIVAE